MAMKIEPGKSIGPIKIGMGREEYEHLLGPATDVFKRTPNATDQIVAYDSKHVHLTLDVNGKIESITVFRPETAELENVQLLGRRLEPTRQIREHGSVASRV